MMRFGPQYIEKDTWQHQLAISNNSQQSAANSALHCDLTLLTIGDRGSLEIWVVSISLNSQPRQSLSTNRAFSSLLAPEWEQSQKVEAFQHSQHPREESSLSSRKVYLAWSSRMRKLPLSVSKLILSSVNYISMQSQLLYLYLSQSQHTTAEISDSVGFQGNAKCLLFLKKSISKWWNELLGSDDLRSLYYFHNNKE